MKLKNTPIANVDEAKTSMPSIVHVVYSYPPNLGGVEKTVQLMANRQVELGLNVQVITSQPKNTQSKALDRFRVTRLKSITIANTTIMPGLIVKLLTLRRDEIVHLHVVQAFSPETVWLASKVKRFKYIAHIHLDVPPSGIAGFLLKIYKPIILKRVLKSASFVVVFTDEQKRTAQSRYGLNGRKVKVIPNGVEKEFFYDKPRALHKKPRLLFVGRLNFQKNLAMLLRALEDVSEQFETFVVGDGEQRDMLKELSRSLKLQDVNFIGRLDGKDLVKRYQMSDIFILTSEREGMPLVLLEAMAMRLPIIATDVLGNRDVVRNNRNGLLVTHDDADQLRSAILAMSNPSLYSKLSNGCYKMAIQYSWNKVILRFNNLYDSVK